MAFFVKNSKKIEFYFFQKISHIFFSSVFLRSVVVVIWVDFLEVLRFGVVEYISILT